jgi:hypothetical protein
MHPPRASQIADILVKSGVIDESQLQLAMAQRDRWGGRLAQLVAEMGFADEDRILDALAGALHLDRIQLANLPKDARALERIDAHFAEEQAVFPAGVRDNGKVLLLAMADPSDLETIDEIQRRARARVIPCVAAESEIRAAILRCYYGHSESVELPPGERTDYEGEITTLSGGALREGGPPPPVLEPTVDAGVPERSSGEHPSGTPASSGVDWTEEALQRLRALQANQEKSARVVRAVTELLMQKGYLTDEELRRRLSSQ